MTMKKLLGLFLLSLVLISCDDDPGPAPSVHFSTFVRTSYVLQNPVDIDGDGFFSSNVLGEFPCPAEKLVFTPNEAVENPLHSGIGFEVFQANGDLFQAIVCRTFDGLRTNYTQNEYSIVFFVEDEAFLVGRLSEDGNQITFDVPRDELFGMIGGKDQILDANGIITDYERNAIITYTREQ